MSTEFETNTREPNASFSAPESWSPGWLVAEAEPTRQDPAIDDAPTSVAPESQVLTPTTATATPDWAETQGGPDQPATALPRMATEHEWDSHTDAPLASESAEQSWNSVDRNLSPEPAEWKPKSPQVEEPRSVWNLASANESLRLGSAPESLEPALAMPSSATEDPSATRPAWATQAQVPTPFEGEAPVAPESSLPDATITAFAAPEPSPFGAFAPVEPSPQAQVSPSATTEWLAPDHDDPIMGSGWDLREAEAPTSPAEQPSVSWLSSEVATKLPSESVATPPQDALAALARMSASVEAPTAEAKKRSFGKKAKSEPNADGAPSTERAGAGMTRTKKLRLSKDRSAKQEQPQTSEIADQDQLEKPAKFKKNRSNAADHGQLQKPAKFKRNRSNAADQEHLDEPVRVDKDRSNSADKERVAKASFFSKKSDEELVGRQSKPAAGKGLRAAAALSLLGGVGLFAYTLLGKSSTSTPEGTVPATTVTTVASVTSVASPNSTPSDPASGSEVPLDPTVSSVDPTAVQADPNAATSVASDPSAATTLAGDVPATTVAPAPTANPTTPAAPPPDTGDLEFSSGGSFG